MNTLLEFLSKIFHSLWMSIAVLDKSKEWTYKEIWELSDYHAKILLRDYKENIAIHAHNSIEWIIIFLAILKSKNKILLIHPNQSLKNVIRILSEKSIDIIYTDNDILLNQKLLHDKTNFVNIQNIKNILAENQDSFIMYNYKPQNYIKENDSISVLSFRSFKIIEVSFNTIISLIGKLSKRGLFKNKDKETYYIAHVDFTYNYIIGLLLPLSSGVPIVITNEDLPHYRFYMFKPNTIILTGRHFEQIYHEYIDISTDMLIKFLKDLNLWFILNIMFGYRLKHIFGDIDTLVILNSDLSLQIEKTLKSCRFPYTITYGIAEAGGIISYSDPKNFKLGTMGKIISNNVDIYGDKLVYKDEIINDIVSKHIKDDIVFHNREEDEITSKFGYTCHIDLERKLRNLALVDDCLLVQNQNGTMKLYCTLDTNYIELNNIDSNHIKRIIQGQINYINIQLDMDLNIQDIVILLYDFTRDHYDRIRRDLYDELYINESINICESILAK